MIHESWNNGSEPSGYQFGCVEATIRHLHLTFMGATEEYMSATICIQYQYRRCRNVQKSGIPAGSR